MMSSKPSLLARLFLIFALLGFASAAAAQRAQNRAGQVAHGHPLLPCSGGLLYPGFQPDVGDFPGVVAAGDLDGDGDPDLAVGADRFGSGSVSVLLNQGAAAFAAPVEYPIGACTALISLDLDGDGDLDLAAANRTLDTVTLLENQANGSYLWLAELTAGSLPVALASADFDIDGRSDLFLANYSSNTVFVLRNLGGSFTAVQTIAVGTGPVSLAILDFDADGLTDLAVANQASNTLSVLRNLAGSFAVWSTLAAASSPSIVSSGDLDGDGYPELVELGTALLQYPNQSGAGFGPPVDLTVGGGSTSMALLDPDGDGDRDIVVTSLNVEINPPHEGLPDLRVLTNSGNGTFALGGHVAVGDDPRAIAGADLDGDADLDLVVANNESGTLSILLNDAGLPALEQFPAGYQAYAVAAADLDGDGDRDLAVANPGSLSSSVSVLSNQGGGSLASPSSYSTALPYAVAAADLNGDGATDLVLAHTQGTRLSTLRNQGNGTFASAVSMPAGQSPVSVAASDLDGDGDLDLAVANQSTNRVSMLRNLGGGVFAAPVAYAVGTWPASIVSSDMDLDGDRDLMVANQSSASVTLLRNTGAGAFAGGVASAVHESPLGLVCVDLDGDGDPDVAVCGYYTTLSLVENQGNGSFSAFTDLDLGGPPGVGSIVSAGLDRDGARDLVVARSSMNAVSVLWGVGTSGFTKRETFSAGWNPSGVLVTDMDGDGDPEIVTSNAGSAVVTVLRSGCH